MKANALVRMGLFGAFAMLITTFAFAGGVSDGGGGTTNPDPAKPEWIASSAKTSGKTILSWLYRQEQTFLNLPPEAQASSPYAKLFGHEKDVFQVMPTVKFELRMNAPCLDASGAPKDGSIYGKEAGSLCLSPFSMAPKLNQQTYERETAALMVHEITHLMGTTEDEAVQIQKDALRDFNRVSFLDSDIAIDLLSASGSRNDLYQIILGITAWFLSNEPIVEKDLSRENVTDLIYKLSYMLEKVDPLGSVLLYIRTSTLRSYVPQYVKLNVIADFVCASDSRVDASMRNYCAKRVDDVFKSDTTLSARQIEIRRGAIDPGTDYDLVTIKRPVSWGDVGDGILQVRDYLLQVCREAIALSNFQISFYRTE